jgi:hypothetical protein
MSLMEAEKGQAELRRALAAKEAELVVVQQEVAEERRWCHGRGSWTMVELENESMTQSRREIRTRRQEINYPEPGVQEHRRLALNRMSSNE